MQRPLSEHLSALHYLQSLAIDIVLWFDETACLVAWSAPFIYVAACLLMEVGPLTTKVKRLRPQICLLGFRPET
jgi:hypothetical protein